MKARVLFVGYDLHLQETRKRILQRLRGVEVSTVEPPGLRSEDLPELGLILVCDSVSTSEWEEIRRRVRAESPSTKLARLDSFKNVLLDGESPRPATISSWPDRLIHFVAEFFGIPVPESTQIVAESSWEMNGK